MWKRKELKKSAKHSLKLNYIACIAVCFVMMFIAGEYKNTTQFILDYDTENVANLKYDFDQKVEIVGEIQELCDGNLKKAADEKIDIAVDKVTEKYGIKDKDSVKIWVSVYKEKGFAALNLKEVTFFGTTGEMSNWETVTKTLEMLNAEEVEIEKEEDKTEDVIAHFFDMLTKEDISKIGVINYIIRLFSDKNNLRALISLFSSLLSLLITIFVAGPLIVGERRFFLENRTYHKTHIGRMGFLFRERCFKPLITMLFRNFYTFFWTLTIIGGFIKKYEYEMIPFILAENPKIDRKKAFKLSKQMMKGNKWRSFIIDISFLPWTIAVAVVAAAVVIPFIGFSLLNMLIAEICCALLLALFINPYKTATKAELYIALRREAIKENYRYSEELNDKYLDLDLLEEQIKANTDSAEQAE